MTDTGATDALQGIEIEIPKPEEKDNSEEKQKSTLQPTRENSAAAPTKVKKFALDNHSLILLSVIIFSFTVGGAIVLGVVITSNRSYSNSINGEPCSAASDGYANDTTPIIVKMDDETEKDADDNVGSDESPTSTENENTLSNGGVDENPDQNGIKYESDDESDEIALEGNVGSLNIDSDGLNFNAHENIENTSGEESNTGDEIGNSPEGAENLLENSDANGEVDSGISLEGTENILETGHNSPEETENLIETSDASNGGVTEETEEVSEPYEDTDTVPMTVEEEAEAKRAADISSAIITVSGAEALRGDDSPQSKAAKWIIEEDNRKVTINEDSVRSANRVIERYSMAVLYFALGGDNWFEFDKDDEHDGDRWLNGRSVCKWQGVRCNGNGRVEELILVRLNLTGTLPQEIDRIRKIEKLDLQKNKISGSIPESFFTLKNLKLLDLSANELEGSIPEQIYEMESLEKLYLSTNKFTGTVSDDIDNLEKMADLRLDTNALTGSVPWSLGNLYGLRYLMLNDNNFNGEIPSTIGHISNLFYLDLSKNSLSGSIPEGLASLASLRHIYLDHNRLKGHIPTGFGGVNQELYTLVINDNELAGAVPSELGSLSVLKTLDLRNNMLNGTVPDDVCELAVGNKNDENTLTYLEADCDVCGCDGVCLQCAGS